MQSNFCAARRREFRSSRHNGKIDEEYELEATTERYEEEYDIEYDSQSKDDRDMLRRMFDG